MPRVALAFFVFAALCGLTGMGWGIYMGITHDHSTFPAHAHLNLIGWVSMALMGAFYALAKARISGWLPWTNFTLCAVGTALMIPSLTAKVSGVSAAWSDIGLAVGPLAVFAGMVMFVGAVLVVSMPVFSEQPEA